MSRVSDGASADTGGSPERVGDAPEVEHEGRTIEKEVRVDADPGRVWSAWTDPERIAGWFVERAVGRAEEGARVTWAWDRFGVELEQEVVVADEPRRLVLRARGRSGVPQIQEITLERDGVETVVRVVQSGFGEGPEADDAFEGTDSGWVIALGLLKHYVEKWFGRSKSELMVLRPAPGACGPVGRYYREPKRLADWLGSEPAAAGSDGDSSGPSTRLALGDGRTITGPVLAEAGSELLRAWNEVGGTLELKAFPAPGGQCMVGVRAVSWKLSQEELDDFESYLADAVDRLVDRLG